MLVICTSGQLCRTSLLWQTWSSSRQYHVHQCTLILVGCIVVGYIKFLVEYNFIRLMMFEEKWSKKELFKSWLKHFLIFSREFQLVSNWNFIFICLSFERPYLMTGLNLMYASFMKSSKSQKSVDFKIWIHTFELKSVDFIRICNFSEIHGHLLDLKTEISNNERPLE